MATQHSYVSKEDQFETDIEKDAYFNGRRSAVHVDERYTPDLIEHTLIGSGTRRVGTFRSHKAALNATKEVNSDVISFAYSFAYSDALSIANFFPCPNPKCEAKNGLFNVILTSLNLTSSSSLTRTILSLFGIAHKYVVKVHYDWKASISCC